MPTWIDENRLSIGDIQFLVEDPLPPPESEIDYFLVCKHRWMVERYIELLEHFDAKRIFILGIQNGGCCVMFDKLASPLKLIAIDVNPAPAPALEKYLTQSDLRKVIRPYYGINQLDSVKLRDICECELPESALDLVIDDASHFLEETRASFNTLFPLLHPGGLYIIEDWPWAHADPESHGHGDGFWPEKRPLTVLIFELMLACGSVPDLIEEIIVNENSVWITRGTKQLNPAIFDIRQQYLPRGRDLIAGLE